ncbi:glycosyltransferase family 2 protein [Polynucleobacter paludilacus]|uniref:glycosyltransferase family 2 protein n=1 Tax=Polynucleobacter paludilacus TaxID=1855895 RepID=UPI001BFDD8FB|nr:glycosyltransferase family 2 protein [Polynucleobacter paludilacus]QWD87328.1 glycosyltransferase family 2 protein [Polynucleobacter paludilacus]
MINIVIPMAGHGSRFSKAGYKDPKPLIPVNGRAMIELVIDNLRPSKEHRFIFICQSEHIRNYPLRSLLEEKAPGCKIIEVSQVTEGAACTVLLAKELINNADQLMIANCDQYIDVNIDEYIAVLDDASVDGLIMTMKAYDDKWSFIKLNERGEITLVVEKKVVSDEATVGIYNYQHGSGFVEAAENMIAKNLRVNTEFYVAPAYNEMIEGGGRIKYFNIGSLGQGMFGLGTPEDLAIFLRKFI